MAGTETQGLKCKKKPPTFRHLPAKRAKKLKDTWVANAKIKSQWKAQKRKEVALNRQLEDEKFEGIKSDDEQMDDTSSARSPSLPPPLSKPKHHSQEKHARDKPKAVPAQDRGPRQPPQTQDSDRGEGDPQPSLREITREAYSKKSLHSFKAGRGRQRPQPTSDRRGKEYDRGGATTGRGQPDMKLRMNAMLEKIKQTMS